MQLEMQIYVKMKLHKVILTATSPFFRNLLRRNLHPHPLIFMRGVTAEDLSAIVDFLYCGEANVFQENLNSFLSIAEDLQLKGLMGLIQDNKTKKKDVKLVQNIKMKNESNDIFAEPFPINPNPKHEPFLKKEQSDCNYQGLGDLQSQLDHLEKSTEGKMLLSNEMQELDKRVRSMMEKNPLADGQKRIAYVCKQCGKEGKSSDIIIHIETIHLGGLSLSCDICYKMRPSRDSLRRHKKMFHSN